jgi:alkylation response protein AidB-like acyl-CoA dehydrogenase
MDRSVAPPAELTLTSPVIAAGAEAVLAARRYADSIAGPVIERDRAGAGPAAGLAALAATGLLAITVPREHGGPGLTASVLAEVVRTIAAADPGVAQAAREHFLLVDVLAGWGTPDQQRLLGGVLAGARLAGGQAGWGGGAAGGPVTLGGAPADPAAASACERAFAAPQLAARARLGHAAIQAGIAAAALRDAAALTAVRPDEEPRAGEDQDTAQRYGRLAARVRAAEAMLGWAAGVLDEVTLRPATAAQAARGELAAAQATAFGGEVAVEVTGELFSMTGAAGERGGLSRHWRNARAAVIPAADAYRQVGSYLLEGGAAAGHGRV